MCVTSYCAYEGLESRYNVLSGLLTAGEYFNIIKYEKDNIFLLFSPQIRKRLHYILKKKNCDVNDSDNFETIMFYT